MKQILTIFMIVSLLSCQQKQSQVQTINTEDLSTEQIDSILTEFKFQYESPIVLDSTDQVLIPISTRLLKKRVKYSKDGYYSDDFPRSWNVLFYNRKTGETQLLTENKIRISEIFADPDEYKRRGNWMNNKILYNISDVDFNQDKKLNHDDPDFLFVSDINGEHLKRISPPNEDLQYFEVIPKSRQILIRTLRDTNEDLVFDHTDESIWYKATLENNDWNIEEIINSTQKKKIENLYFEQWLKKN